MTEWDLWPRLALAVLATWRVTHLLANEDGPGDAIVRIRRRLGSGALGHLMDCFNCLSLWVAAPMALIVAQRPLNWCIVWLAVSGGACLLQRVGKPPVVIEPIEQTDRGDPRS
jgi:Protein of unknown function (DUF1360)